MVGCIGIYKTKCNDSWLVGIHKSPPTPHTFISEIAYISSHSIDFVSDVENGGEAQMEDQFDDADNDDNMEQ